MKLAPPLLARWMRVQAYALPGMLLVALTLPGIGQGWFRTDAPRYAALSMRVFDGGPWWGPRLGELPYFNKPPLAFWAQGLVYQVTGPELWATRATHLVVALAGLLITVDLVRRLSGRRAAMLAGVSLATTLEFFRYARTFSLDLWLVALFAAAAWLVAVGARRDRSWWIVAAGVPLGLSLLVKPMLAAVPALVLAVWLVWIGRPRPRKLGALLGAVLVAIAVAAPWHVAMAATYGEAFLSTYFGSQTVGRVEGTMAEDHPWWFYLVELPKGAGPWVVTAALCVVAVARGRIGSRDRWLWRLAVVGALVWIVLPSLLGDRRPRYIVPAYPFVAMLSGLWLARVATPALRGPGRKIVPLVGPVALAGSIVVALTPLRVHAPVNPKWARILDYHAEHGGGAPLWTAPGANTQSSNLYLLTGTWPRLARVGDGEHGSEPPAGALVIVEDDEIVEWAARGEVVVEADNLRVVRVGGE